MVLQEKFQHETVMCPAQTSMISGDSPREEPPTWPGRSGVALLTAPLGWVKQTSRVRPLDAGPTAGPGQQTTPHTANACSAKHPVALSETRQARTQEGWRAAWAVQEAGMALAYGDYVDAPPVVRVAALVGLADLALCSARLTDMLALRVEESSKERAQRLKQTEVRTRCKGVSWATTSWYGRAGAELIYVASRLQTAF